MKWCAVIVGAGRGERFGTPKQYVDIASKPMLAWSLETFANIPEITDMVLVSEEQYTEETKRVHLRYASQIPAVVVAGGATRQESVRRGLDRVSLRCEGVLVHDAARPLVSEEQVRAGMSVVRSGVASLLAVPVVDTIKEVATDESGERRVVRTLDRGPLWAAQTPQFAMKHELWHAHEDARSEGIQATDDVALLERVGVKVIVVPGSDENFKVTYPFDKDRAEALLRRRLQRSLQ